MKVVAFDVDLDFVLGGVAVFDIVFAFVVVLFLSLSSFLSNVLVMLFFVFAHLLIGHLHLAAISQNPAQLAQSQSWGQFPDQQVLHSIHYLISDHIHDLVFLQLISFLNKWCCIPNSDHWSCLFVTDQCEFTSSIL